MIIQKERTVRLSETDATGILYFTNLFKFAVEAFEEYLAFLLKEVNETFQTSKIALPIIDAHGEFKSKITVGDEITITLTDMQKKNTSLTTYTTITKGGKLVANVKLTHVAISKATGQKVMLDECGYRLLSANA